MRKTYTKPEIVVSKFDVETVITNGSVVGADLTASIYTGTNSRDAVAVVDYTTIFSTTGNN